MRSAFATIPDYGPEIRIGARVMDTRTGVLGVVVLIRDGCHWSCQEHAEQWRPRAAYVLDDGRRLESLSGAEFGGRMPGGYVAPEHLARVPDHWTGGWMHPAPAATVPSPLGPGVARQVEHGRPDWWLMNHAETGWASYGYGYGSLGELLASWDLHITGFGEDRHGVFAHMAPGRGL